MKVVFICGGIGKRMWPMTKDKTQLNFCGKPLIVHQIETASSAGLDQFVIIANRDNITDIKNSISQFNNIRVDFAIQEKPLGMADALVSASHLLSKEPMIVVNPNDVFEISAYTRLLDEFKRNNKYSAYITAQKVQTYFPGGYLITNEKGEIGEIVEKPPQGTEPSELINIVVHLYTEPQLFLEYLSSTTSETDDTYEKAINRMISDGHKTKAVIYDGAWQAIKYPWHILSAMDYFLQNITSEIAPTTHISDKAIIDGDVVLGNNVRIFEGAIIRGPSYIGQNTIIGNNVLIRQSTIGNDSVIGFATEIKHSHIGNKCWFHSNYIGDSVIEDDCSCGAGAVTANFRLDEGNIGLAVGGIKLDTGRDKLGVLIGTGSRIGINASLMPGVRIGSRSFVGSHVCLTHDLEANKMALAASRYQVWPNDKIELDKNKRKELFDKLIS